MGLGLGLGLGPRFVPVVGEVEEYVHHDVEDVEERESQRPPLPRQEVHLRGAERGSRATTGREERG